MLLLNTTGTLTKPVGLFSRPDLIDMEAVSRQSNRENLEQAFEIAESLGVTSLLDAEGEPEGANRPAGARPSETQADLWSPEMTKSSHRHIHFISNIYIT